MGTSIGYYEVGQRVELTWKESIPGEGVFNRTDTGTITEMVPDRCNYIFVYIDTDNSGEKVQNIGRKNVEHGRVKKL